MGTLTNLKKALLTSSQTALIPYDLEAALNEELIRLQPLLELMAVETAGGKTHEYSLRTAHPQGWFEGETTPMNQLASTYERKSVVLKIGRIWGGVTGFAQAVDEPFINALAAELEGSVQGMSDLFEYSILFGCANDTTLYGGDAYQTTGLLPWIFANANATRVYDAGGNKLVLDDMDVLLAEVQQYRQTARDPYIFFMSQRMKQVADGLQSKVQLPLQTVELADGKIVMAAYGGAPIFETNYLKPGTTSPACTAVKAAGGSLTAGDYKFRISSVTIYGECVGGVTSDTVTTETTNLTANLSWTPDADALLYMIFRQTTSGSYYLIDIIAAKTYDGAGTVNGTVAAYVDNGAKTPSAYVKPLEAGEEQIVLANRNPQRGIKFLGRVDDMGRQLNNLVSYIELARTKDTYDYMLKSYFALLLKYKNMAGVIRHAKLS